MPKAIYSYKTIDGVKKRVHRHIMEKSLGRLLQPHEHVYHLNSDPNDNRIENLVVIAKNPKNLRSSAS